MLQRLYQIQDLIREGHALAEYDREVAVLAWGLLRYHVPQGREIVGLILKLTGTTELAESLDALPK